MMIEIISGMNLFPERIAQTKLYETFVKTSHHDHFSAPGRPMA